MSQKLRRGIFSVIGFLILILDSRTALEGGIAGVRVCLMQVIPSLLPFFVLSILLGASFTGADIPLLRPIGKLCRMPKGSENLLLIGLLGGYPAGAQSISQAYQSGQLNQRDARRLLGFCNNAGPAFLFGIAAMVFEYAWLPWALWLIHICSALLTGILLPGSSASSVRLPSGKPMSLPDALQIAVSILSKVCAWIVIFRIIQAFLEKWLLWLFPTEIRVMVIGVMELANGCIALPGIADLGLRAVLCSLFLALGGLSVTMQTLSVAAPLSLDLYIPGKCMQVGISSLLTLLMVVFCLPESNLTANAPVYILLLAAFLGIFALVLRKYEKNSSIIAPVRV